MARGRWMRRFARWHIWLGWLVGVPILLWTLSGVVMVLKPIEEVRGDHLRISQSRMPLTGVRSPIANPVELRSFVQRGRSITLVTDSTGALHRYDATSRAAIPSMSEAEARRAVAETIRGGARVTTMRAFAPNAVPLDLRKPVPTWQATLADGTHVYLNRDSGEIEAVRTRWWRFYDFLWGIHIMDLQTREDAHNPFTIAFGSLALLGSVLGLALLFRRRKARVTA
jgi:hypothetical protein